MAKSFKTTAKQSFINPAAYLLDNVTIDEQEESEAAAVPVKTEQPKETQTATKNSKGAADPEQATKKNATKSERLNLLLYPKLKDDLKALAEIEGTSVNDLINKVLEEYTSNHEEKIERYKTFCEERKALLKHN